MRDPEAVVEGLQQRFSSETKIDNKFNTSPETGPNQQTVILHMPILVY